MAKKSLINESDESGILNNSNSELNNEKLLNKNNSNDIINKMSYADRQLRELNSRLANVIDISSKTFSNICSDTSSNTSSILVKDFGTKIEAVKKDYEIDISVLQKKLQELNKKSISIKKKNEKLSKNNSQLIKKLNFFKKFIFIDLKIMKKIKV